MEMHNLAAVNAAIAAIETSAELENEPVSLEAQDDKDYHPGHGLHPGQIGDW